MGLYPEPYRRHLRTFCLTDACEEVCTYHRYPREETLDVIHEVRVTYEDGSSERFAIIITDDRYKGMDYREISLDILDRSV
jgi:hypothetical protein